jgi:hypothetical protein
MLRLLPGKHECPYTYLHMADEDDSHLEEGR